MTKKTMARECRRIWEEVAKTGKIKWETKAVRNGRQYENDCPACQYALDLAKKDEQNCPEYCVKCPLLPLWYGTDKLPKKIRACPCEDSLHSPYRLHFRSIEIEGKDMDIARYMRKVAGLLIVDYLVKTFKLRR